MQGIGRGKYNRNETRRKMKGRSCANGSKQRSYLTKYESVASPTVSLEGMMAMLLIGIHEGR